MTTINGNSSILASNPTNTVAVPVKPAPVKGGNVAPTISASNSSSVKVSQAGMSVARAKITAAAVPLTVQQVLSATSISAGTVIKDTAANIQANLKALANLAGISNVISISLSDTKAPTLSVSRTDIAGDLASAVNPNATLAVLKKITSSFTLNVTDLSVADALTLKSPATTISLSLSIGGNAEQVSANFTALQTLAKAKSLASLTITNINATDTKPVLSITSSQLKASPELLATLKGDYDLTVTGVASADVLTTVGAADKILVASGSTSTMSRIVVGDTSANLVKNIALLETAATAGRLTCITVSDGKNLSLTETQLLASSHALAVQFTSQTNVEITNVAASDIQTVQAQIAANSSLILKKESISDTAANIQSNLDNLESAMKAASVGSATGAFAIGTIAITDKGSLSLSNTTLIRDIDALKTITGAYKLNVTEINVADALALKPPSKEATLSLNVVDTATNISANWDKLQVAAKAKTLTSLTVTDSASRLLSINSTQFKSGPDLLALIKNDYRISVTGVPVTDLAKTLAAKKIYSVGVADTAANILKNISVLQTAVSASKIQSVTLLDVSGPAFSISDALAFTKTLPNLTMNSTAKFAIKDTANNIIAHARNDIGNVLAMAGSIAITDKTAPTLTLADAKTLKGITNLDKATKYNVADGGAVIAAQAALADEVVLSGATTVKINKNFTIAEATVVNNLKALTKGTPYSIVDTAANIIARTGNASDKILTGANTVSVSDTSANILAALDQLEGLAKAGKIANIKFTDAPSTILDLTQAQLLNDAEAIGKIVSQKILPVLNFTTPNTPAPLSEIVTPPTPDTAPSPLFNQMPFGSITNNNKPTFSGTAGANAIITLYNNDGSTPIATVTATASGNWSYTPTTALADGSYSITAKAANASGVQSAASPAVIFKIDTVVPPAPTMSGPVGSINVNKPVLSGTAEANSTVTLYNNNGTAPIATVTANLSGQWTYAFTSTLTDGSYSITAKATDPAGNNSVASTAAVFKIDTTPPAVPTLTGPSGATSNNKPTFTGTAEAGSTVKLYNNTNTLLATMVANATGQWTYTPSTALVDGSYSVTAKATDAAGNSSVPSSALVFTLSTSVSTPATMTWAPDLANGFEQIAQLATKTVSTPKAFVSETINLTAGGSYSFGTSYSYSAMTTVPTITLQLLDASNTVVASSSNLAQGLNYTATKSGTYTLKLVASNAAQDATITKYGFTAYQQMSKLPSSSGDSNVDALLNGLTPFWLHPAGATAIKSTSVDDLIHDGLYSLSSASSKHQITYSFLTSLPANDTEDASGFRAMNQTEKQAVTAALSYIASVINVTFTLSATAGQGDINFGTNNQGGVSAGYANLPNSSGDHPEYLFLANDQASNNNFSLGTYGWQTLIHEIGHTLGLKHPGNYNAGGGSESPPFLPAETDNTRFSIMSYNQPANVSVVSDGYVVPVNPQTFMVYDLAALQYLYGANKSTAANQTYNFTGAYVGMQTIWSPNGATINLTSSTKNNLIDLRQGAYSSIGMTSVSGQVTYDGKNNVGIAYGSIVDAVVGGSGSDFIYANSDGDVIDGGAGADTVYLPGKQSDWTITVDPATSNKLAKNNITNKITTLKQVETVAYYDPTATSLTHA